MSTNRSKDRSSLCSLTFVGGHERTWCPVAPAFRGGLLFARIPSVACLPQAGEGPAFRSRSGGLQTGSAMAASALVSSRAQPRDSLFAGCVQTLHLVQDEYINAFGIDSWRETIRTSHRQSTNHTTNDNPESAPSANENTDNVIFRISLSSNPEVCGQDSGNTTTGATRL